MELEAIRQPRADWYSMKGTDFHLECSRNSWFLANQHGAIVLSNQKQKEIDKLEKIAEYIRLLENRDQ